MATIEITTQSGAVGNGDLQLQNGAPMDATLRFVTDAINTASPLKLSTSLVQTTSTLQITTNDNPYIDAEDGTGNNRFTVGRAPASQQVNVDFASNPAGSTTAVGAIRTYRDGTNLSEAMTFIEDGSVGIGTTTPNIYATSGATNIVSIQATGTDAGAILDIAGTGTGFSGINMGNESIRRAFLGTIDGGNFGIYTNPTNTGTVVTERLTITPAGNVGIGTTAPATKLDVTGDIHATIGLRIGTNTDGTTGQFSTDGTDTYLDYKGSLIYRASASSVERMRITSAGNVGIGTTTITTISGTNPVLTIGGTAISGGLVLQRSGTDKARLYESGDLFIHQGMSSVGHSFYVNASTEAMRITAAGNVGIGTTSPTEPLVVSSIHRDYTSAEFSTFLQSTTAQTVGRGGSIGLGGETGGGITSFGAIIGVKENSVFAESGGYLGLMSRANGGPITEKARITSDGYLRMLSGTGGIQFNGDTAAANALDDYEEGTFTPSVAGHTTSGTATYTQRVGVYTKIGRQVSIQIDLGWSSGTGTGNLIVTGLPFADTSSTNPAITIGFFDGITLTANNYALSYIPSLSASVDFVQTPVGGGSVTSIPYDASGRVILNVTYTA